MNIAFFEYEKLRFYKKKYFNYLCKIISFSEGFSYSAFYHSFQLSSHRNPFFKFTYFYRLNFSFVCILFMNLEYFFYSKYFTIVENSKQENSK